MSKILELRTKRNTLWEQTKDFLEKNRGDNGLVKAKAAEQYNKMAQEVKDLGTEIERLEQQAQIEAQLSAPTSNPVHADPKNGAKKDVKPTATAEYAENFWNMIRNRGHYGEVRNALSVGEDAMLATVVSTCEKYRMIEAEEQKAQAELHKHAKSENEAVYPKEKAMYDKLAADASTRCLMAYQWRRDFNIALQKVEPFKARMVLEQHFIRGQPLKAIEVGHGKTMSRTTATHYKKVGIRGFARELEKILPDLESKEKIIFGK